MVFRTGENVVEILIRAKDEFSETFKQAGIGMKEISTAMVAVGAAGAALGGGLLLATKSAAEVETGFAKVNTLLDEGQDAAELFGDTVKELNVLMGNQGDQLSALDGLYQTISAGISDTADAAFFMEKATIAATGGSADLGRVIEAGTKTIAAFGFEIEDTERVFDVFAGTVKAGQTTMEQLATAFPTVAGTAGEMGVSLEETAGIFAGLTKVMAGPEEASTSLNAVLTGLIKPSTAMKDALEELGFESGQAAIEQLGLMGTLKALEGTTDGSAEAMGELFGNVRALRAIFPILGGAADDVAASMDIIENSTGLANKQYEDMADTIEHRWGVATSEMRNLLIEIGTIMIEILIPILEKLNNVLRVVIDWWNNLSEGQQKAIVVFASVVSVVMIVIGVIGVLIKLFTMLAPLLAVIKVGAVALAGAVGAISAPVLLVIGAIAALIAIGYFLIKHWDVVKQTAIAFGQSIKNVFFSIRDAISSAIRSAINSAIDILNVGIRALSRIPGINIPVIPTLETPDFRDSQEMFVSSLNRGYGDIYNIDIETIQGADPDDMAEAFQRELKMRIGV